jgi:hypothetical protein
MSFFFSTGNTLFHGSTYKEAVEFLARGRKSKYRRPIAGSAFLTYQPDWSISLVLFSTCVVTYHEDGTYTLDHNGWRTPMTQVYIRAHSPFYIGSTYSRKFPGWGLGYTDERTPPRVQKCRMCNGRGGDVYCSKCSYWERGTYCHAYRYRACPHGKRSTHYVGKACNVHQRTAWTYDECYRCKGKGVFDYGSERIPILWGYDPVRLTADKTIVDLSAPRYYPPINDYTDSTPFSLIAERDDISDLLVI